MEMSVRAVICDADGMIVRGERFSERLARDFGILTDTTQPFFLNEFQACLIGDADLKSELEKQRGVWGWTKSIDELLAYWFADEHNRIDERFAPVISRLRARGIKVYLATNNEKHRTDDLVERRGLGQWFDAIFSSGYMGAKKPEAAFFEQAIAQIGVDKESLQFWDDDRENIDGASANGVPACLYTDFNEFSRLVQRI